MAEELFKSTKLAEPAKAGVKQPEATTQELANTAEKIAEENKEKPATQETPKEPVKEASQVGGVPSLGSNSSSSQPAPVVPVPAVDKSDEDNEEVVQKPDELSVLKDRAKLMGLKHSNNIGVDALRSLIQDALTKPTEKVSAKAEPEEEKAPAEAPKKMSIRKHLQVEKMKLVRLRITNLDPKKKDLPGEILTIANRYLGTVRKYIPFGEITDNGWHVPYCLYEMLRDRKFLSIKTRKDPRNGQTIVEHQWVKEFALEVLEPLTDAERAQIAANQHANGID